MQMKEEMPGACCDCRYLYRGVGVGIGLRCISSMNAGRSLARGSALPSQGFPYPLIPSLDFVCANFRKVTLLP
jgi:hypothetical protein